MLRTRVGLLLLVLAAPKAPVLCQSLGAWTGTITGHVRSSSGDAVAGAQIVLTGAPPTPRRSTTTDERGRYAFSGLAARRYNVEASGVDLSTVAAERLSLLADQVLRVDFELEAGAPGKFTVSAQPLIDVSTPARDLQLQSEDLDSVPRDRGIESLFPVAAALTRDRQSGLPADSGDAFSLYGASVAGTPRLVDGVDTTDTRRGLPSLSPTVELVQTVVVHPLPHSARSDGPRIHLMTRAGGGSWKGGATLQYTDDGLGATSRADNDDAFELLDGGAWGGGPLVEGRAWLFAGLLPQDGNVAGRHRERLHASGKLDLRPRPDLLLAASGVWGEVEGPADTPWAPFEEPTLEDAEVASASLRLSWNRPRFLLRAAYGRFASDRVAGDRVAGDRVATDRERQRRTSLALDAATHFAAAGDHTFSLGIEEAEPRTRATAGFRARTDATDLFVEDRWQLGNRLTLSLGLRTEAEEVVAEGEGETIAIDFDDRASPHLGVAWDVRGNGQWRLHGAIARLRDRVYHALPLAVAAAADIPPVETAPRPPSSWAASLGTYNQILPNVQVAGELVYRDRADGLSLLAVAPPGSPAATFVVANPGAGIGRQPYGGGAPIHPGLEQTYLGLELFAAARFSRWGATLAYVLSELEGNYDGLANADDTARPVQPGLDDTCGTLEGCFTAAGAPDRGPLALDRQHRLVFHGFYRLPGGLVAGTLVQAATGTPFARRVALTTVEDGGAPVSTRLFKPEGRGSGGHLPSRVRVDLRLQWETDMKGLGGGGRIALFADVSNLFDEQTELARRADAFVGPLILERVLFFSAFDVDALAAVQGVPADPRFGNGFRFEPPRRLRLGVRLLW